ncbi:cartilage intermediate layer protein 1 [Ornithorhynchus anatinus]|nr:cartilage intermediate layer protein 1 [Ornithorhynchus anatinus]
MTVAKGWIVSFLLLEAIAASGIGRRQTVLTQSVQNVRPGKRNLRSFTQPADPPDIPGEWTTWFNIDHPGGHGDYERLDAIRFYYKERVCPRPTRVEARTTDWIPAEGTGQVVHASPQEGFWCLNKEQVAGRNCSNYTVRFLCPVGSLRRDSPRLWTPWTEWSVCSASCGHTGVQTRTRTCLAQSPQSCNEPTEEGQLCLGQDCAVCDLSCTVGRVNADCDACMCEDFVLRGAVSLPDGSPAAGAAVHLLTHLQTLKPLTRVDARGRFRVPGLCPDGRSVLRLTKAKFAPLDLTVPKTGRKEASVQARFSRAGIPYITKNPQTKARRVGQSVSLCCKAVGTPSPNKYLWYHNGTLLEPSVHRYDNSLMLKNLQKDQAGEYFCKASSPAGSVKSQVAKLSVIDAHEPACNPKPESYLVKLPHDCFQNATGSFYYDVGRCPAGTCAGPRDPGLRCQDEGERCCGVSRTEERTIVCGGYTLPTKVATACSCQKCPETRTIVRGRAVAADDGEPLRFGHVYLGDQRVGMTGYQGTFSLHVPPDTERLILTFVDRLGRFVNSTKVLPFGRKRGAVFHEVKMLRRAPPLLLEASETNVIPLGERAGEDPMAELEIPPGSFYRSDGRPYEGRVRASVTFLDARDVASAPAAQSDLSFVDEEGDVLPLRTYGMFSVDFAAEAGAEPLNAGRVKVWLDAAQVKMPEHAAAMKLWSLAPDTGLWEEEGDFRAEGPRRRRRREERTFLVGNMEIRERRLFNLDVPESRRCLVKVRAYRGDRFLPSEQLQGVVVSAINLEPSAGFASNPRAWGRFDSVLTGPNGACVPAFCDERAPDAYSAFVTASLGGEELEAAASAPKPDSAVVGVPEPYLSRLKYRRSDHEDPRLKKTAFRISVAKPRANVPGEAGGPVFPAEDTRRCEEAPPSAPHFRFYRIEGDSYDYNTVPFSEDDPLSWTADYLAWWPKPMEFRACYVKVRVLGAPEVNVRSRNAGGTHPLTAGRVYGLRDVRSIGDRDRPGVSAACLEFKCSGMLYDQARVDRTLVTVIPQGSCQRVAVNPMLHEYLVNHLPLAVNNDTGQYTMLAPLDPLGHNYGIYTVTDQDPKTAKEIALGRCFDGTSDGSSRVMKSDVGVALTFNCAHREVGRQSTFQYLRGPAARPAADRAPARRRQRESRAGSRPRRPGSPGRARPPLSP